MTTFYYRITDPVRVAAFHEHTAKRRAVDKAANDFAALFLEPGQTATPYFNNRNYGLAHIKFSPTMKNDVHWTVPNPQAHDSQNPRANPKKQKGVPLTDEEKAFHEDLVTSWAANWPKLSAPIGDLMQALLGVDDDFMTSCKITEGVNDEILVECNRQSPFAGQWGVQELLGSEYAEAVKAADEANKSKKGGV
jgi:hypothetical protein